MRVLHVTTEYPPIVYGGLGTAVGGLVTASQRAGIEVAVVLVGAGAHPPIPESPVRRSRRRFLCDQRDRRAGLSIPHQGAAELAVRFAERWRPDVIHVYVFWLADLAIRLREAAAAPLVYTVHSLDRAEYEIGCGPPECLTQWNIQYDLIAAADRVVALTTDERDLIGSYCPGARPRIRVVGNGIADSTRARASTARRRPGATVTVLYTGRFVERKGIRELLEAAAIVLDRRPGVRFVLAGGHRGCTGEDMSGYWMPATCVPFRDRITFTGWCDADRLDYWYETSDVLLVPSWYEPFGMVILEGMLHGLAIVASDVGGPRAILDDGVTGLLCPPRSPAHLSDALRRVVDDHDLRQSLGERAARQVRTRWLFDNVVEGMHDVYTELTHDGSLR